MGELQIVHQCDHRIITKETLTAIVPITKGSGDYDVIDMPNIIRIDKIIMNYEIIMPALYYLQNQRINWVPRNNPVQFMFPGTQPPDIELIVLDGYTTYYKNPYGFGTPITGVVYDAYITYVEATLTPYGLDNCPRCYAQGWYIAPAPVSGDLTSVTGALLVAQAFLKCLLSEPGTDRLDVKSGAGLLPADGIRYFDKNVVNDIYMVVSIAESQTKASLIERGTESLDELLDRVEIVDTLLDIDSGKVYVELKIYTMEGSTATFGLVQ